MSVAVLERSPVEQKAEGGLPDLVAQAASSWHRAGRTSLEHLVDETWGGVIAELARVESRASALRLALSAEADRRRVAEATAESGTDAWVARLTGSTREQAASGLRIARLLQDKYAVTREAFARGLVRVEQVRVIVDAAEQAPVEATAGQAAEEWLVARATGAGTRTGRGLDAKRLRQAARRMFATIDHELSVRHEAILLGVGDPDRGGRHVLRPARQWRGVIQREVQDPRAARPPAHPGAGPVDRVPAWRAAPSRPWRAAPSAVGFATPGFAAGAEVGDAGRGLRRWRSRVDRTAKWAGRRSGRRAYARSHGHPRHPRPPCTRDALGGGVLGGVGQEALAWR